ncbi:MAG: amidohydrolase family protein [Rudaea sp.]|uniref:amidohydrolase family protein n=1 Tax=Rudaea sp. TaxID=2136325 RepID=UPI0039E44E39
MFTRREFLIASAVAMALGRPGLAKAASSAGTLGFKLFDAHCHLRTDDLVKYPRAPKVQGAGGPPGSDDPHANHDTPSVEAVLAWMDANDVAGAATVQHRLSYGFDNRYILDSADAHRNRLVPVCVLDAEDPGTPARIDAYVRDHGLAGIRLTGPQAGDGAFPWLSSRQALATWAAANKHGLCIDVMTVPPGRNPAAIAEFSHLARQFPNVRLVLNHIGWLANEGAPDFGLSAEQVALKAQKNIYYKFSTINIDLLREAKLSPADTLRHVVDVYDAGHVLWGSDIGNSVGPYSRLVDAIVAASVKLTSAEKRAVLHDTGKHVYARGGWRA